MTNRDKIEKVEELFKRINEMCIEDGDNPIIFLPKCIDVVLRYKKYKNLFEDSDDEVLILTQSNEVLQDFIQDVQMISIGDIMDDMVKTGYMEKGVNKDGEIVYTATEELKKGDLGEFMDKFYKGEDL